MKRFLLFVMVCVCVSIGAWAQSGVTKTDGTCTVNGTAENVVIINITTAGSLSNVDLNSVKNIGMIKVVGQMDDDDIEWLNSSEFTSIDLQDAYLNSTKDDFTISNPNVRNLILPDNWTKAQVNAAAAGCSNLGSAVSFGTTGERAPSLTAYVKTGNTLRDALTHSYYDGHINEKIGEIGPSTYTVKNAKSVVISGNPVARDFSSQGNGGPKFDENGHFVFNEPSVEAVSQPSRVLVGTAVNSALDGANIVSLDLSSAYVTTDDLTLSLTNVIGQNTKEVVIPTDSRVTTLPADFLNINGFGVYQICIPSNIQYIKTRALPKHIDHIWTTGPVDADGKPIEDGIVYDNGCYKVSGSTETKYEGQLPFNDNTFAYGTYTFSPNLKVIESYAFNSGWAQYDSHVKDIYVLSTVAPECHVDAFHSQNYIANHTVSASTEIQSEGIITREAYTNGETSYTWMTVLHYPNATATPEVQHYTDPTRVYSVATGQVDGRGANIYFPTQTELTRSYLQGTTGYLWNAWDPHRTTDGSLGFVNSSIDNVLTFHEWSAANQQIANNAYLNNQNQDFDKTYTSFYDATANGTYTQPEGLELYDKVKWDESTYTLGTERGTLLYPQMGTTPTVTDADYESATEGRYVKINGVYVEYDANNPDHSGQTRYDRKMVQATDEYGRLKFKRGDCGFVQDYEYVKDANGKYVHEWSYQEDANGNYVQDYEYVEAANGAYYHPMIQETSKDQHNPKQYYYAKETGYQEDPNGDYIYYLQNGSYTYVLIENAKQWYGLTDEVIASDYTRYSMGYTWVHVTQVTQEDFWNPTLYKISTGYERYVEGVFGYTKFNSTRYNKEYLGNFRLANANDAADEPRYSNVVDNGIKLYDESLHANLIRLKKSYKEATYREFDETKDDLLVESGDKPETRYCRDMVESTTPVISSPKDYRGWHQFVLTAYAHNSKLDFEPIKSYITDSDWWTICVPYNLRYTDMLALFGDPDDNTKLPYLSKLMYVVRDVEKQKITLMFSKNLMVYKEQFNDANGATTGYEQFPDANGNISGRVHGVINDTKWETSEIERNPVILHAGVPYLIKPNMPANANRQFNIYKQQLNAELEGLVPDDQHTIKDEILCEALRTGRSLPGPTQKTIIYNGEYEVPAYLINNSSNAESPVASKTFTMKDGSTFTYPANAEFEFKGQTYDMKVSNTFTYTFVGSFYLSVMPQYAYFLGWDSSKNKAAFWYNRVADKSVWSWNNETGIICANWPKNQLISNATSIDNPARWVTTDSQGNAEKTAEPVQVANDDFTTNGQNHAKGYMDMGFDNSMLILLGSDDLGIATGVEEVSSPNNLPVDNIVYDIHGMKVSDKLNGLAKGIYIVNGRKYVVK